ncbi:MAG: replicative DNA helicase [Chloroflexota bacterium]
MQVFNRKDKEEISFEKLGSRVPPNSLETERAVLGCMLLDRQSGARAAEILQGAECFYSETHKQIYTCIKDMYDRNVPVDTITLRDELQKKGQLEAVGGTYYLAELSRSTPTAANAEHYATIILEKYLKRALIQASGEIMASAYDDGTDALLEIDNAESKIFAIASERKKANFYSMKTLAFEAIELINKSVERRDYEGYTGVPTGFISLDRDTSGFQNSDLIILAARPSMGKTALALSMARNMAVQHKRPIAFFSLEMTAISLVIRLLSSEAMIDQNKIKSGRLNQEEMNKIVQALGRLSEAPIIIDDSSALTLYELRSKCRRLKAEHNIEAVFVDYIGLIASPKAESREREISIISKSLKQLAKELNIPVVTLAQLNRQVESRGDRRPQLSDLRESGSIEQDADVVLFINRPEQYGQKFFDDEKKTPTEGMAEIIIGKQRNGPTGIHRVAFMKSFTRFENLSDYEEPPEFQGESFHEEDMAEMAPF